MQTTDIHTIERDEIKRRMDRGEDMVLLEVLPRESYEEGHLPGARHLPPDQIREKAPELVPDRNTTVVTYCADADCELSTRAYKILRDMGYENVYEYVGSKKDWREAGLPLEQGATVH